MIISQNQLKRLIKSMINETAEVSEKEIKKKRERYGVTSTYPDDMAVEVDERISKLLSKDMRRSDFQKYNGFKPNESSGLKYFVLILSEDEVLPGDYETKVEHALSFHLQAKMSSDNPRIGMKYSHSKHDKNRPFKHVAVEAGRKIAKNDSQSAGLIRVVELDVNKFKKIILKSNNQDIVFDSIDFPSSKKPKEKVEKLKGGKGVAFTYDGKVKNLLKEFGLKDKNEVKKLNPAIYQKLISKSNSENRYESHLNAYYDDSPDSLITHFIAFGEVTNGENLSKDGLVFEAQNDAVWKVINMHTGEFGQKRGIDFVNFSAKTYKIEGEFEGLAPDGYTAGDQPVDTTSRYDSGAGRIWNPNIDRGKYAAIFLIVVYNKVLEQILIDLNLKNDDAETKSDKETQKKAISPSKAQTQTKPVEKTSQDSKKEKPKEVEEEEVEEELDYTIIDPKELSDEDEERVKELRKQLQDLGIEF